MTPPRRTTHVETTALEATCLRCRWSSLALNAQGNAAKHHDATGHPVTVDVTRRIVYGDPSAAPDGQARLNLAGDGEVAAGFYGRIVAP